MDADLEEFYNYNSDPEQKRSPLDFLIANGAFIKPIVLNARDAIESSDVPCIAAFFQLPFPIYTDARRIHVGRQQLWDI